MRVAKKNILLIVTSILSGLFAIKMSCFVAEELFFDKFYYYKSIAHGYWNPERHLTLESFGERSHDLVRLTTDLKSIDGQKKVFGTDSDKSYTIAIVGDSFVWGQGVRFKDTISQLLEKKLNEYKETTVVSLGSSGDSILDYFIRYEQLEKTNEIDLYVFVLVENDLLLVESREEIYKQTPIYQDCQSLFPKQRPIYDMPPEAWDQNSQNKTEMFKNGYMERFDKSWQSPFNVCILEHSLKSLPTQNAIFFVAPYDYNKGEDSTWKIYIESLKKDYKRVLFSTDAKTLPNYEYFWNNPWKSFRVSNMDGHPSEIAHRMYADLLKREILTNQKWRF